MSLDVESYRRLMALFEEVAAAPDARQHQVLLRVSRGAPSLARELARMLEGDRSHLALEAAPLALARHVWTPRPVRVAGFEFGRELGRGGSAVVYAARQRRPDREVALKVVHPSAGREAHARLLFEADALAQLQHPDIPRVFSAGRQQGVSWLALELIHGVPLDRWPGRSEPEVFARLMARVARAVHHAHLRGLLHCDLSPRNIVVTPAAEPRLLDFGSARGRLVWGLGPPPGTEQFMSPQRREGSAPHVADDVFSLGAIVQALGGARLEAVGRRALAPARSARFPSAEALARALEPRQRPWWRIG